MEALELRLTHGYVGTYKHLDKWLHLGTIDVIGTRELPLDPAEDDITEPKGTEVFALIKIDPDSADFFNRWINSPESKTPEAIDDKNAFDKWVTQQIATALMDTYSSHGCAHEHDCCGCRSYSASNATRVARGERDLWRVEVHSSRNY